MNSLSTLVMLVLSVAQADIPAQQFVTQHCQKCHSGAGAKGDFNVATLNSDFNDRQNQARWLSVLEQLKQGSMPPKENPRPPELELSSQSTSAAHDLYLRSIGLASR